MPGDTSDDQNLLIPNEILVQDTLKADDGTSQVLSDE
jgi:hypothetical protein